MFQTLEISQEILFRINGKLIFKYTLSNFLAAKIMTLQVKFPMIEISQESRMKVNGIHY